MDDLAKLLPLAFQPFDPALRRSGLVIVDEVNGFCSVGQGALAPSAPDPRIARMVTLTEKLARTFVAKGMPILALLDTHESGKAEPPYPPHCEKGSGEERLVPELAWLEDCAHATLLEKDCIDGFIGATDRQGGNQVVEWVGRNGIGAVLAVGICTDVCVMDFVLSLLSARNHGMMPTLRDVAVFAPACATYDLPAETAAALGLPEAAAHPADLHHRIGLSVMAARGATIADQVKGFYP